MEQRDEKFSREVWDSCGSDGEEMPLQNHIRILDYERISGLYWSDISVFRILGENLRH
jgi:hypothetical protein